MRMPPDQLRRERVGHVVDGEAAVGGGPLRRDPRVEEHLEQDVADLLAQRRQVAVLDRLGRLVGLLKQVPQQRRVRLLPVPRAGHPQRVHDRHQVEQVRARQVVRPVQHPDLDPARTAQRAAPGPRRPPAARSHTTGPSAAATAADRNAASAGGVGDGSSTTSGTTPAAVSAGISGCPPEPASTRAAARSADQACQVSSPGATRGLLSRTVSTPG